MEINLGALTLSTENVRKELLGLILNLAYKEGSFTLASGAKSDYYIDLRRVTMHQRGALLTGLIFLGECLDVIRDRKDLGITGMTMGADPIITSTALVAELHGVTLHPFYTRRDRKEHGTGKTLEGFLEPVKASVVVEDVATTGGSALKTIGYLQEESIEPIAVIALVDRLEGARENVESSGFAFKSIFTIKEIKQARS